MSDFLTAILWLALAILFARWGIGHLRRHEDWRAALTLSIAATYVVLAMTVSLR